MLCGEASVSMARSRRTDSGQGSRDVFEKASMNAPAIVRCTQQPGCVCFGAVAVYAACFTCCGGGMHKLWRG